LNIQVNIPYLSLSDTDYISIVYTQKGENIVLTQTKLLWWTAQVWQWWSHALFYGENTRV